MSIKIKLYAVSLMAATTIQEPNSSRDGAIYWEHAAALISSDSVDHASLQARKIAFDSWPKNQGWIMHSADITPVTSEFFAFMQTMIEQGHLTGKHLPAESPKFFNFEDAPPNLKPRITAKGN